MKKFTILLLGIMISFSVFAQNGTDINNNSKSVQNMPLFEEFTSSTCPPCSSFNASVFTPFMNAHPDDITVIKYQMNWPSPGDPYYTAEGGVRRTFYSVNSVPDLFAGGEDCATTSSGVNNAYTTQMSKPAYFTINATHQINGNNITVQTDIFSENDELDLTVHMVVIEKLTTGNVGNNGETEFHNVMMKMLPDADGTTINFTSNFHTYLSETYDMSSTFVEEMDDLEIVVFIQNNETKEVLQSAYSVEAALPAPTVSFWPADGVTISDFERDIIISFNQFMRFVDNSEITNANLTDFISLTDPSKGSIAFTATINDSKSLITLNPVDMLPESSVITITVDDAEIEGINNVALAGTSASFTTEAYPVPSAVFNPENGATDVNYDTDIVLTFDLPVRFLDNSEITNGDISSFVTLTDPSDGNIAYTGTINPEKTIITIDPDNSLPELTDITVTIAGNTIENKYDNALAESSATFTTGSYPAANVIFNPFDGETNVGLTRNVTLTFDHPMRMLDDSEILNEDISSFISLTDPTKGDIAFTGTITSSKNLIVLNPDENLPGLTDITVTIAGNVIENVYDKPLSEGSATFTTENAGDISKLFADIKVYPNPASNVVFISNAKNSIINISDIFGKTFLKKVVSFDIEEININYLTSGLYIIKIELNGYSSERKLIIVK